MQVSRWAEVFGFMVVFQRGGSGVPHAGRGQRLPDPAARITHDGDEIPLAAADGAARGERAPALQVEPAHRLPVHRRQRADRLLDRFDLA